MKEAKADESAQNRTELSTRKTEGKTAKTKPGSKKRGLQKLALGESRFASLTAAERRLLEVLLDPLTRLMPITEICAKAKISRQSYYMIFDRPAFVELYDGILRGLYKREAMAMSHSIIREGKRGSFQHAKLSLEVAGVYTEKREHEVVTETYAERIARIRRDHDGEPR